MSKYRTLAEARAEVPMFDVDDDVFPVVCESLNESLKKVFDLGAFAAIHLIDAGATTDDLLAQLLRHE